MSSFSVKILDCTLRDGGYLNDWVFGRDTIYSIVSNLNKSGIDFIECGFLKETAYQEDVTFFDKIESLKKIATYNQNYTVMVNFGEYDISNFSKCNDKNIKIRVAFKKHNQKEAIEYIKELISLGWDVFANPMSTNTYSGDELMVLINELNSIKPFGVSIVDTLGNMYEKDILQIFSFIDKNLSEGIALGFHSHNSLQLSFANTKALLKMKINRLLIIDSCLYGMGRGAGNLCTELITKYLNDNFECDYEIFSILKSIEEDIKPFYQKSPWGYSTPFYIAAIHGCHPNYAQALINMNISNEKISEILQRIPINNRAIYDKDFINTILVK